MTAFWPLVRYIDTGARDPSHALGTWLEATALRDAEIDGLRWQSGFFGARSVAYFVPLLTRLREADGVVHVLVGSNDGTTTRSDIEALLEVAGPARAGLRIGIVSYENAYFHPKTIHVTRSDGSAAAYVGSANLTGSGVASLHVEAGLLLDTREGDDANVLTAIAGSIDSWFEGSREGLRVVESSADLDPLVGEGILNVPRPVLVPRPAGSRAARSGSEPRLAPLIGVPAMPAGITTPAAPTITATPQPPPPVVPRARPASRRPRRVEAAQWGKQLTRSDAQRKTTGNQRGSITLVTAGYPIDAQTYFRRELFAAADWVEGTTRTGQPLEIAFVPFDVEFLGSSLGEMNLQVTYAPNREASQANYTSLLHLGPLDAFFVRHDLTGRRLELSRAPDGSFSLSIQ